MININAESVPFVSGISSLTVTQIIAPAEKERKNGRSFVMTDDIKIAIIAPISSTIAEKKASIILLAFDSPAPTSGREIMAPSGIF